QIIRISAVEIQISFCTLFRRCVSIFNLIIKSDMRCCCFDGDIGFC
ncbi:unnamed protein product, partial [Larinioides sclopetarius]